MEKHTRGYGLSLFLSTLSLLLGILNLAAFTAAYQAARPTDDALAVSGQAQDTVLSDVPSDAPSDGEAPPSLSVENETSPSEPSPSPPIYTVRLVPTDQASGTEIGIYDASNALVLQAPLPLATLPPDDQAALQTGFAAESFEQAQQLVRDFCG